MLLLHPSPCGLNTEKYCFLRAGQSEAGFVPWEIQSTKDLYFLEIFFFFFSAKILISLQVGSLQLKMFHCVVWGVSFWF